METKDLKKSLSYTVRAGAVGWLTHYNYTQSHSVFILLIGITAVSLDIFFFFYYLKEFLSQFKVKVLKEDDTYGNQIKKERLERQRKRIIDSLIGERKSNSNENEDQKKYDISHIKLTLK